jgi:hypothetical protein
LTAQGKKMRRLLNCTYGTAWVYRLLESQEIVANCQQIPQKEFDKELLSIPLIELSISNTIAMIRSINPSNLFLQFRQFVISRMVLQNQLSKSHLFTALHAVLINANLNYFPSYEIMMDELRDYRFIQKICCTPIK